MAHATKPSVLDARLLRTTGALLATHTAVSRAIETEAIGPDDPDSTTLDLLVRLDLSEHDRVRAADLSRQLMLSASHVSRRLDRAEGAGLVRRRSDPVDRRAQLVSLTREGRGVVADFAPRLERVIGRIVGDTLSGDEIDVLVELLSRLEAAARAHAHSPQEA